jgi:hypothetical protein
MDCKPSERQLSLAAKIAPHLVGLMDSSQIATMLSVLAHHAPNLAWEVSVQMVRYAENPKKRKREALAAMADTDSEEEVVKKKVATAQGRPNALEAARRCETLFDLVGNRAPCMCHLAREMLKKYRSDPDRNKMWACDAYSIMIKVKSLVFNGGNPDSDIEIKESWKEFDTWVEPAPIVVAVGSRKKK